MLSMRRSPTEGTPSDVYDKEKDRLRLITSCPGKRLGNTEGLGLEGLGVLHGWLHQVNEDLGLHSRIRAVGDVNGRLLHTSPLWRESFGRWVHGKMKTIRLIP
jgi:hypothetical protein